MDEDIIIRPCRTDECEIILKLWQDAGSTPSVSDTIDNLKKEMQSDGGILLVAECEGTIIGTVMGGWDGWRGNIYRLAVLPDFRLRGIGRRLVREVERQLVDRGARKLSILVEKNENIAVTFWDAMKNSNRHWLAANMTGEAFLGFGAFNTKKITGQDVIDFLKFRQDIVETKTWDLDMFAEVLGKPQK